jgi:GT2 family glycosyltransferase
MIHIVIPVFNRWHFTQECLKSLRDQTYKEYKVIIVDHGSTDGTSSKIKQEYPEVLVLTGDESMWWTAATNMGVKYALTENADYVLTLNNDLVVNSNYLENLNVASTIYKRAIIGSVTVDKLDHERIVYAGTGWNKWTAKYRSSINLKKFTEFSSSQKYINSDLLPGRGTLIPISAFKDAGIFDEINFPHYAADEEFAYRCKKVGYQLIIPTDVSVFSEVEATGLKNIHTSRTLYYYKDLFTSIRSPLNIKYRWRWAVKCTPIPLIYFTFDLIRIIGSQFKSKK